MYKHLPRKILTYKLLEIKRAQKRGELNWRNKIKNETKQNKNQMRK